MTIAADYGRVRSRQGKPAPVMAGNGEARRLESFYGMATLALAVVGRSRELAAVHIHVTTATLGIGDPPDRVRTFGDMTFGAGDRDMTPLERIVARSMLLDAEEGGLEALDFVALGTVSMAGPELELPAMRVLLVAIHALCISDRRLVVDSGMTRLAGHRRVLSQKRVFGSEMAEQRIDCQRLPVGHTVARLAVGTKSPAMGIIVAGGAIDECQFLVLRIALRTAGFRMALDAGDFLVRSFEPILCPPVIELARFFPARSIVATLALRLQLPPVLVGMAVPAFAAQAQIRPADIFYG